MLTEEGAHMNPIQIPHEWSDDGLITCEEFCNLIHSATHRARLAPTPHRSTMGAVQRLRPPLHHLAEARRFLSSATPTRLKERVDG
jgi:hypothetical protein